MPVLRFGDEWLVFGWAVRWLVGIGIVGFLGSLRRLRLRFRLRRQSQDWGFAVDVCHGIVGAA